MAEQSDKNTSFQSNVEHCIECFKFSSNDDQIHIMYVVFDKEECKSRNNNNDANSAFWKGWLVAVAHTQDRIPVAVLLVVVN